VPGELKDRFHIIHLFDAYGRLLTPRQQRLMRLYYHDDLSLGEIAERLNITRQAVHDSLQRSLDELARLEEHLQLVRGKRTQQQEPDRGAALRQRVRALADQARRLAEDFDDDNLRRIAGTLESLARVSSGKTRAATGEP
jgi:predicted DNA-binding protein YlxM (UPF0122 family)